MNFQTVMTQVARFNSQAMAKAYQQRRTGRWIVLGDNGEYWVTCYRYTAWLVKAGYEMMEA